METLDELIEKVRSRTATLYCEQGGKMWQVHLDSNDGAVRLHQRSAQFGRSSGPSLDLSDLTAREKEMIDLIVKGYTYRYISQHLRISEGTVKKTVHNAYVKLKVASRIELINAISI